MGAFTHVASRLGRRSPVNGPDSRGTAAAVLILAAAGFGLFGSSAGGQDAPHLSIIQPGGFPGVALMTGAVRVTNGVNVTWYGPPGYYQLYQALTLVNPAWQSVGGLNYSNNAIVATVNAKAFFRVAGAAPQYAGSQTCAECHAEVLNTQIHTAHAGAYGSAQFLGFGGGTNASCYVCHTVGAESAHRFPESGADATACRRAVRKLPRPGGAARGESGRSHPGAACRTRRHHLRRLSQFPVCPGSPARSGQPASAPLRGMEHLGASGGAGRIAGGLHQQREQHHGLRLLPFRHGSRGAAGGPAAARRSRGRRGRDRLWHLPRRTPDLRSHQRAERSHHEHGDGRGRDEHPAGRGLHQPDREPPGFTAGFITRPEVSQPTTIQTSMSAPNATTTGAPQPTPPPARRITRPNTTCCWARSN